MADRCALNLLLFPDTRAAALAELKGLGLDVLYDDRDAGPGAKFADAELLGCPLRVTLGARSLQSGELELQQRCGLVNKSIPLEGAAAAILAEYDAID